jgi:hypothetical protein
VVDDSLAGNAVPAIEAISRVNIVRRKQLLHKGSGLGSGSREIVPVWPIRQSVSMRYYRPVKRLLEAASPMSDPQGRVALMLCESLFHLLVEEGVITKAKAMEAIEGVAELMRETAETGDPASASSVALHLVEAIAKSFASKDCP